MLDKSKYNRLLEEFLSKDDERIYCLMMEIKYKDKLRALDQAYSLWNSDSNGRVRYEHKFYDILSDIHREGFVAYNDWVADELRLISKFYSDIECGSVNEDTAHVLQEISSTYHRGITTMVRNSYPSELYHALHNLNMILHHHNFTTMSYVESLAESYDEYLKKWR